MNRIEKMPITDVSCEDDVLGCSSLLEHANLARELTRRSRFRCIIHAGGLHRWRHRLDREVVLGTRFKVTRGVVRGQNDDLAAL